MRTKVILQRAAALDRVIDGLAEELIESTDEELLQAARDLGMDPLSRGSAAFVGIKYPATWRIPDFFELPIATTLPPAGTRSGGRKKSASSAKRKRP